MNVILPGRLGHVLFFFPDFFRYSPTAAILIFMSGSLLPSLATANICVKQGTTDRTMLTNAMTFRDLMKQSTMFVDKTLLIKDFLELPTKVVLITCPRRWGKSLNMDMIREFLQITPEEIAQQTGPGAMSGRMLLHSTYELIKPPNSSRSNYRGAKLPEINKYKRDEDGRVFWDHSQQRLTGQVINIEGLSERKIGLSNWSMQQKDSFNLGGNSFFDQNSKRKTFEQIEYTSFNHKPARYDLKKPDKRVESGWSGLFNLTPQAMSNPLNKLTSKLSTSSWKLLSNRLVDSPANRMLRIKTGPSSRPKFPRSLQLLHQADEEPAIGDDLTRLFKRKPETKNRNKAGSQKRSDVSAYRMFSHGETNTGKYTRLAIADWHEVISQYLGQHPVLHVSLLIPFGYSFDRILESLQQKLAQVYTHYAYVFKERAEDERDNLWRDYAQMEDSWSDYAHVQDSWHDKAHTQDSWQDAQAQNDPFDRGREMLRRLRAQNATEAELADSLRLLSQLLHQRYGARVFVLIDDYDTPVNLAFARYAGNSREHERLITFMSRLFANTFANNPHVEKSLVTGVNAIAVHELFAEVDYEHHNMLRSQVRHFSDADYKLMKHSSVANSTCLELHKNELEV